MGILEIVGLVAFCLMIAAVGVASWLVGRKLLSDRYDLGGDDDASG